ncbi:Serine/threonine-protein kinase stk11, partial [Rhizophlyctis rosea]
IDSSEVVWASGGNKAKFIAQYLLGEQVGKGSFGKVKEGLDRDTLRRVAVKIINRKRLKKVQGGVGAVTTEIKLLRRLKHPNIITLLDVFCKVEDTSASASPAIFAWFSTIEEEPIVWQYEDGPGETMAKILKWYLIFEYCPCSLQTLVEQAEGGRLGVDMAHRYFVQLIEGLDYLHSQSVIHRDIKPGNLLITPDGVLQISDFGIAEQFSMYSGEPMETGTFAGTHQFLSPEITSGAPSFLGEKVDVWACGVTLFNMLTGRYPFEFDPGEEHNVLSLYDKIQEGRFDMPKEFDPDLQDLLYGMLRKDPATRLSTSQILSHPWTRTFFDKPLKSKLTIQTYPMPSSPDTPTTPSLPLKP